MYLSVSIPAEGAISLSVCFSSAGCVCNWWVPCIFLSHCHHHCHGSLDSCLCDHHLDCLRIWYFSLTFYYLFFPSIGVTMVALLRLLLLTACSNISLRCNNTDVIAYTTLLTVYLQPVYLKYESVLCTILHLHIFGVCLGCVLCLLILSTPLVSLLCMCLIYIQSLHIWLTLNPLFITYATTKLFILWTQWVRSVIPQAIDTLS